MNPNSRIEGWFPSNWLRTSPSCFPRSTVALPTHKLLPTAFEIRSRSAEISYHECNYIDIFTVFDGQKRETQDHVSSHMCSIGKALLSLGCSPGRKNLINCIKRPADQIHCWSLWRRMQKEADKTKRERGTGRQNGKKMKRRPSSRRAGKTLLTLFK